MAESDRGIPAVTIVGVAGAERVGASSLGVHVADVFDMSCQPEVVKPDAVAYVAGVSDFYTRWDRTDKRGVCKAVSAQVSFAHFEVTVSLGLHGSIPQPASVSFDHVTPEAIFDWANLKASLARMGTESLVTIIRSAHCPALHADNFVTAYQTHQTRVAYRG